MRVLLDTNVLIAELRSGNALRGLPVRWAPVISVITAMELHALSGISVDEEADIAATIAPCTVLPVDQTTAILAGPLEANADETPRTRPPHRGHGHYLQPPAPHVECAGLS